MLFILPVATHGHEPSIKKKNIWIRTTGTGAIDSEACGVDGLAQGKCGLAVCVAAAAVQKSVQLKPASTLGNFASNSMKTAAFGKMSR